MKIIHKNEAEIIGQGEHMTAIEYGGDDAIDGAVVELFGRYPDAKRVMNTTCRELIHVMKGLGVIVVEGERVPFDAGDTLLIQPGEKYFLDAHATLFIASTPVWYPEQHKEVT